MLRGPPHTRSLACPLTSLPSPGLLPLRTGAHILSGNVLQPTALDELLPQADLWLHGHLHCAIDYRDASGRCRVVANPLGYARKNEQIHFQAQNLIEIGL